MYVHIALQKEDGVSHKSWVVSFCHPSSIEVCKGHDPEKDQPIFMPLDELHGEEPSLGDIDCELWDSLGCDVRIVGAEDRVEHEGRLVRYWICEEKVLIDSGEPKNKDIVIMEGHIGYVCFFNYARVDEVVGKNLTAREVLTHAVGGRELLEQELQAYECGETRIGEVNSETRALLLQALEAELEIQHSDPKWEDKQREAAALRDLLEGDQKIWTLQFKDDDGEWRVWDETGYYIQLGSSSVR